MNLELPMLIKRCLTFGIQIYPHKLETILKQYESKQIPDKELSLLNEKDLNKYVEGLYLTGQEMSREWSQGLKLLKELGFEQHNNVQGHRNFISLVYKSKPEEYPF